MNDERVFNAAYEQLQPETAHVLFLDIVGYSKLASDLQPRVVHQLRMAVRNAPQFKRAREDGSLICLPTGDGMALVFTGRDVAAPLRTALEIASGLRAEANIGLRMGIHTGTVFRVPDINGTETVVGAGINFAQRVMDCGDAGHIMISQVHASFLREFAGVRPHLTEIGEAEVKHGVKVELVNYYDGTAGSPALPSRLNPRPVIPEAAFYRTMSHPAKGSPGRRVALIYKRGADPDETVLQILKAGLEKAGCDVFIDRHLSVGLVWAREIERVLRASDAVVPLLSSRAVLSEMLAYEIEIAAEAAEQQGGRPQLLPVRINWEGPLPEGIKKILDPIQYVLWRSPPDNETVIAELISALDNPASPQVRHVQALEAPGGAMPLDSNYYIERPQDGECHRATAQGVSFVLVEGARQMGKTSLLSRALQRARKSEARVACVDLQAFGASDMASSEAFFITLGTALANQLDLDAFPEDVWRTKSGANENFTRYLRREVLGKISGRLVWGLDELDRLFSTPFCSEVCGLFRSWHNARASDPDGPWRNLTQILCYATEAHLLIPDLNQSPFNVGVRIPLQDFSVDDVKRINSIYGGPLRDESEVARFQSLFGGQPYLVRRALHELVSRHLGMAGLEVMADTEEGPFSDHLKRFLVLITRTPPILEAVQCALSGRKIVDETLFNRLRAAGLMRGSTADQGCFRCELYRRYLGRHLLHESG